MSEHSAKPKVAKAKRSRLRRWFRRICWSLASLLGLVLLMLGVLLVTLQTDFGREQVRKQLQSQLGKLFVGKVSVGKVKGSLLSDFSLHDISVFDANEEPAISFTSLEVEYDLFSLFSKQVALDKVILRGLKVDARVDADGAINLAHLLIPDDEPPPESDWQVLGPKLQLRGARVSYTDELGQRVALADLEIDASFSLKGGDIEANLARLDARVHRPGIVPGAAKLDLPLAMRGVGKATSTGVTVESAELRLGTATFDLPSLLLAADGQIHGQAKVFVPASLVQMLYHAPGLLPDVSLALSVDRAVATAPIEFALLGTIGTMPLALTGQTEPDLETLALRMQASELDFSKVMEGRAPTLLSLNVDASATGFDPATMTATLDLGIEGSVGKSLPHALQLRLGLSEGVVEAHLMPKSGPKWIDARGRVQLSDLKVLEASLEVKHSALQRLAAPYVDVAGDVHLRAQASGALSQIALEGSLSSERLRGFGNRTRGLRANWKGTVAGDKYAGQLKVAAASLQAGGKNLGALRLSVQSDEANHFRVVLANRGPQKSYSVDLDSEVVLRPLTTTIDLRRVAVEAGGLSWRGSGGRIVLLQDDAISVDGLALRSSAGHVKVDGSFKLGGGFSDGTLDLLASDIDLADLSRMLKLDTPLEGTATLEAQLSNQSGRHPRANVALKLIDLRVGPEVPATSGTIAMSIDRRELGLDASLAIDGLGEVRLQAEGRGPRQPLAAPGWARLDERALTSLTVEANNLDLSALAALGDELPRAGSLSINANLGPSGKNGHVKVAIRDVLHSRLTALVQGELQLDLVDSHLAMSANATVASHARLAVQAQAQLPGPLLDPKTISRLSEKALLGLRLELRDINVDWWQETFAPQSEKHGLLAEVDLDIKAAGKGGILTLRARQPKGGSYSKTAESRVTVKATASEKSLGVELSASMAEREVLRGHASVARGWRSVLEGRAAAVADAAIRGELTIYKLSFAALQSIIAPERETPLAAAQGHLVATATVSGTIEKPTLIVSARTEGAVVSGTEFSVLRGRGEYTGGRVKAEVIGKQKLGGELTLRASSDLTPDAPVEASLNAKDWDLGFLKQVIPERSPGGLLSANLRVSGRRSQPLVLGSVRLRKGKLQPGAPFYGIRNLSLDLKLGKSSLAIEGHGNSGAGTLKLAGAIALREFIPHSLKLDLVLKSLPVQAGPRAMRVNSETAIRGQASGSDWKINVDVGDTIVSLPAVEVRTLHVDQLPDDIVFVDSTRSNPVAALPWDLEAPSRIIDVYVRAPETIAVRGEEVRTIVDVDLHARLAQELSLEGTVATRGGWVDLFGRRYELRRGDVSFSGSVDPGLDIDLTHEFSSMVLGVAVTGTGTQPALALRADPARFDDAELLAFVLGASPDDQPGREQAPADKAAGAATGLLANQLQSIVKDVVPIDVLQIELAEDQAAAEQLTVGKWLSAKIFLAYRRRFDPKDLENFNEALIEYRFKRRWLLETFYGDENTGGLDLLWIRRF